MKARFKLCFTDRVTNSGFSIMELYFTILLVGIVAAISIPNLNGLIAKGQLQSATQQVLSDLASARMKAVSQNSMTSIAFNSQGDGYDIYIDKNKNNIFDSTDLDESKSITHCRGVEIFNAINPIFSPNGTVTNTGNIVIKNTVGTKNIHINIIGRLKVSREG